MVMKISRLLAVFALTVLVLPSAHALAIQEGRAIGDQTQTNIEAKACEQIGVAATKLQHNLDTKKQAASEKRGNQGALAEKRQKIADVLAQQRQVQDIKRSESFEKLQVVAETDEEKTAIEAYIATVSDAVATRRAAYDTAIAEYRTDLNTLLSKQRGQSDGATGTLKLQLDQSVATARASCQAGTPVKDVLATLKTDVQTAQNTFRQSRKTTDIKPQIEALSQTKRDALKAATEAFSQTTNQAREDLKTAFGASASSLEK